MKQKIIEFFQELPESKTDQFNKLFELYRESPDKSINTERMYNASGFSQLNLENLIYDLKKLHGIKDIELLPKQHKEVAIANGFVNATYADMVRNLFEDRPVILFSFPPEEIDALGKFTEAEFREWCPQLIQEDFAENVRILDRARSMFPEFSIILESEWSKISASNTVDQGLANELEVVQGEKDELENQLENSEEEKNDLQNENDDLNLENERLANEIAELKKTESEHNGKLREEFEFLNEKDTPDIAHVLVGRKLAAWKRYQANHAKLQQIDSGELVVSKDEELQITSESVEDFADNQAIYDELNHYKENKEFLKKHSVFRTIRLQEEVEEMKPEELIAFKNSSAKYFSVNKNALAKADEETAVKINARVDERKEKLALVNKKLGINAKK